MLTKGAYTKLLEPSKFHNVYYDWPMPKNLRIPKTESAPINYSDPPIRYRKLVPKKYSLGFRISKEMIEDDLYGDIFNMKGKRKKLVVTVTYKIEIDNYQSISMTNGIIHLPATTIGVADLPHFIRAVKKLATYNKVKPVKKVVMRKRRVKK